MDDVPLLRAIVGHRRVGVRGVAHAPPKNLVDPAEPLGQDQVDDPQVHAHGHREEDDDQVVA